MLIEVKKMEAFSHRYNERSIKFLKKLSFIDSDEPDNTDPNLIYYHLAN